MVDGTGRELPATSAKAPIRTLPVSPEIAEEAGFSTSLHRLTTGRVRIRFSSHEMKKDAAPVWTLEPPSIST